MAIQTSKSLDAQVCRTLYHRDASIYLVFALKEVPSCSSVLISHTRARGYLLNTSKRSSHGFTDYQCAFVRGTWRYFVFELHRELSREIVRIAWIQLPAGKTARLLFHNRRWFHSTISIPSSIVEFNLYNHSLFFFSFFFHLVPLSSSFSLFHLSPLDAQINLVSPIPSIFFFPPLSSTHVSRVQFVSLSKLCSSLFSTAFFLNSCASFLDCFI